MEGTNRLITTSASTSPSIPRYPFCTTSSQTMPSRTLVTRLRHSCVPKAALPSSPSSSTIAFKIVRYKLQTLILVVREDLAIGAWSTTEVLPFESVVVGAVITGRIVDNDSGNRRVRNKVEDCR